MSCSGMWSAKLHVLSSLDDILIQLISFPSGTWWVLCMRASSSRGNLYYTSTAWLVAQLPYNSNLIEGTQGEMSIILPCLSDDQYFLMIILLSFEQCLWPHLFRNNSTIQSSGFFWGLKWTFLGLNLLQSHDGKSIAKALIKSNKKTEIGMHLLIKSFRIFC